MPLGKEISILNRQTGIIMFSWILGALILSYAFTSSLIAALSKPAKEQPMRTWQDLISNNFTILTSRYYWNDKWWPATTFDNDIQVNRSIQKISYNLCYIFEDVKNQCYARIIN